MVSHSTILKKIYLLLPFAYPNLNQNGQSGTSDAEWSYADTNWGTNYPQCNGNRQSPIHIQSQNTYLLPTKPLRFKNYDIPLLGPIELTNNGHSVEFSVTETVDGRIPTITGGILKGTYEAVGVHFHWGGPGSKGSEHIIDGRQFDVEMHIVHRKTTFATMEEATQSPYGIVVLGVMFKAVQNPDRYYPGLNRIFNKLLNVETYGSSTFLDGSISLGQLLGDLNTKNFFTYKGSLTTPGCSEAVLWHVFPDPMPIAQEHVEKFWTLTDSNGQPLTNNFRPTQDLNGRLSGQEIRNNMMNVLGESAPSYATVKNWAAEFKCGRRSIEDEPRSRRPKAATTIEIVAKVHDTTLTLATDWTYDNAPNWSIDHPNCGGNRQSPIHIKTST
ncbi:carbonic anhydrase 2-like, partial [Musca vetustissima]|uniref:carbonic anhydrase 2-like n=1 Tax=Musca vetustissima TaxID=27455 RepID=UPI002AB74943